MNKEVSYRVFNESGAVVPFNDAGLFKAIRLLENHESCHFQMVEVVFVDNDEMLRINSTYLKHEFVTDIITFPYDESNRQHLDGTLYCCASQIEKQAIEFGVSTENETLRVVIHGLLHLASYDDRTEEDRNAMRELENKYIRLYLDK